MIKKIIEFIKTQKLIDELNQLSDRELKDIGIMRSDIYRIGHDVYKDSSQRF